MVDSELPGTNRWGGPGAPQRLAVCGEHRDALAAHLAGLHARGRWFLPAIAAVLAAVVGLCLRFGLTGLGPGLVAMGALLGWMPYATPETVRMFGYQRSVQLVRAFAGAFVLAGIVLAAVLGRR